MRLRPFCARSPSTRPFIKLPPFNRSAIVVTPYGHERAAVRVAIGYLSRQRPQKQTLPATLRSSFTFTGHMNGTGP